MTPKQLISKGEHENEWGGYFIIKGHEKLIRMLLMTRKNFPITVQRSTWKDRGQNFSDLGIMVRSVRTDQTTTVREVLYNSKTLVNAIFYACLIFFRPTYFILSTMERLNLCLPTENPFHSYQSFCYSKR